MNVNPFFSLHLNKDEHGEKVLHPSINLHITPSEHIFTKLIDKKHHVKKVILHNKLNQLSQTGPYPPQIHPPILQQHPQIIYSQPPNFPHIPEDIHYPPPYGNPHITPYEGPGFLPDTPGFLPGGEGFIPGGDHIPFGPGPGPTPYFDDHPNSGFNPLYDAPPNFQSGPHYRNANLTRNFQVARAGKSLKNDKNVIFPNNRKRRDVTSLDNSDSLDSEPQHTLSRSRVSLLLDLVK